MFYVFIEFDGPYGRSRMTRGFVSDAARQEWASSIHPCEGDEWSDYEEWEAPQSEWAHIPIIGQGGARSSPARTIFATLTTVTYVSLKPLPPRYQNRLALSAVHAMIVVDERMKS